MNDAACILCGEELKRTTRHKLYFTIHIDSDFGDTPDITAYCCTKCYDMLLTSLNIKNKKIGGP